MHTMYTLKFTSLTVCYHCWQRCSGVQLLIPLHQLRSRDSLSESVHPCHMRNTGGALRALVVWVTLWMPMGNWVAENVGKQEDCCSFSNENFLAFRPFLSWPWLASAQLLFWPCELSLFSTTGSRWYSSATRQPPSKRSAIFSSFCLVPICSLPSSRACFAILWVSSFPLPSASRASSILSPTSS